MKPLVQNKKALVGVILVLAGTLLLLDHAGMLSNIIPAWMWSWKFLLIVIGIFVLLTGDRPGPGIILIVIGSVFLAPEVFRGLHIDPRMLWYVVIIAIGIYLIFARKGRPPERGGYHTRTEENGTDIIDELTMFGGGEKIFNSDHFSGGRLTVVFGGLKIDFSRSKLAPGTHEMEVFTMFGGWELIVPPDWNIKTELTSVLGGVSDKRHINHDTHEDPRPTLVIRGFVMLGGGEIKGFIS